MNREVLKRFAERGLLSRELLRQLKVWGYPLPSVATRPIKTKQELELFLEELDTDVQRAVESFKGVTELGDTNG